MSLLQGVAGVGVGGWGVGRGGGTQTSYLNHITDLTGYLLKTGKVRRHPILVDQDPARGQKAGFLPT